MEALKNSLNELIHVPHTTFICGDFNLPNINWLTNNVMSDDVHNNFFDFISSHGMTQFVHRPTRHSSSGTDNVLDLIFSNDPLSVIITNVGHPLGTSDHATIEFNICLPSNTNNACNYNTNNNVSTSSTSDAYTLKDTIDLLVYDWSAADYGSMNEHLANVDWHQLFGYSPDTETIWANFKSIIWPIIDLFVPKKKHLSS